jgi:cation diffusion facilitator family transporter
VNPEPPSYARLRLRAIWLSLMFGAALLGIKFAAYVLTSSTAILSDAFESIVNVAASAVALYTVWLATQPADASHPYGHGKAESFSAGFEGGLILLAAVAILWEAVPAFWAPQALPNLGIGLLLISGAGVVNLVLGGFLVRTGRRTGSIAVEADGHHLLSDSVTTAGVLLGLVIVRITGWLWVDPAIAALVALNLLRVGVRLMSRAVATLMDQADPTVLDSIAAALVTIRRPGLIEVHNLRSWRTGRVHHVDFHLTVPRFWGLEEAHRVEHEVAAGVGAALQEDADVIIHLDPCVPDCCVYCDYEPCPVRLGAFTALRDWTGGRLVRPGAYQRGSASETDRGD